MRKLSSLVRAHALWGSSGLLRRQREAAAAAPLAASSSLVARNSRRRRSKSLASRTTAPPTTKDRIRQIIERNQRSSSSRHEDTDSLRALVSVAAQRVSWVQSKVLTYWNPDYNASAAIDATPDPTRRVLRHTTVMDRRWWAWNLAFSLLPATIIGLYCEFRVKPAMEVFTLKQQEHERQRLSGKGGDKERSGRAAAATTTTLLLEASTDASKSSSSSSSSWTERLQSVWKDWQLLLGQEEIPLTDDDDDDDVGTRGSKVAARPTTPSTVKSHVRTTVVADPPPSPSPAPVVVPSALVEDTVTLKALALRVQELEGQLRQHQQQLQPRVDPDIQPQPIQSGIQRRRDQQIRESWVDNNTSSSLLSQDEDSSEETTQNDSRGLTASIWKSASGVWSQVVGNIADLLKSKEAASEEDRGVSPPVETLATVEDSSTVAEATNGKAPPPKDNDRAERKWWKLW
jgi:hypothetical protein